MISHDKSVPDFAQRAEPDQSRSSASVIVLLFASAFLFVVFGLLMIIPKGPDHSPVQSVETPGLVDAEVSRAGGSLLELDTLSASEVISRLLRQPIRLTDSNDNRNDLTKMTAAVLADFGYVPRDGDRLQSLLVQALSEGQSNAYIDALLNTAAARGEFKPPRQLVLRSGRMDTKSLLSALLRQAQNQG